MLLSYESWCWFCVPFLSVRFVLNLSHNLFFHDFFYTWLRRTVVNVASVGLSVPEKSTCKPCRRRFAPFQILRSNDQKKKDPPFTSMLVNSTAIFSRPAQSEWHSELASRAHESDFSPHRTLLSRFLSRFARTSHLMLSAGNKRPWETFYMSEG